MEEYFRPVTLNSPDRGGIPGSFCCSGKKHGKDFPAILCRPPPVAWTPRKLPKRPPLSRKFHTESDSAKDRGSVFSYEAKITTVFFPRKGRAPLFPYVLAHLWKSRFFPEVCRLQRPTSAARGRSRRSPAVFDSQRGNWKKGKKKKVSPGAAAATGRHCRGLRARVGDAFRGDFDKCSNPR